MMKKLLLLFVATITALTYSCVEMDNTPFEPEPEVQEPHIPQDRKIKSIFIKSNRDSLQSHGYLTEKYNYFYGSNGFIEKNAYWYNTSTSESSVDRSYYYTHDLVDSIVVEMKTLYTAGVNEGKTTRTVFANHYFHNDSGFITEVKKYIREHNYANNNLLDQTFFYYNGDLLSKAVTKNFGILGEKIETVEVDYHYRDGNFLQNNDQRNTFDDKKFYENKVYSPSMHRISCHYINNITSRYYGYSNIELSTYTYNEDLYPVKQIKRNEKNELISTHIFEYY